MLSLRHGGPMLGSGHQDGDVIIGVMGRAR